MSGKNISIIKKITLLVILLIGLDFITGQLLRKFYFSQQSGFHAQATYAMEKCNEDILVFGASTANHHYVPHYFMDSLNMSFYNAGRDGSGIFYHYAMFRSIIGRYSPKVVILDVHPDIFMTDQQDYDRLSELLPFYKSHPEIREILNYRSPFEPWKHTSSIYPFNSEILSIAIGNAEVNKERKKDVHGYEALYDTMKTQVPDTLISFDNYGIDSLKVKVFEQFIADAARHHIHLFVVRSPKYIYLDNPSTRMLSALTAKYQVPYLNYGFDPDFIENPFYFGDFAHLNDAGAHVFSRRLADVIETYFEQPNLVNLAAFQ